MKISKLVPAIGICAICVSFGSAQAQDNAAQAAARAALMKQMDQVQAPEAQTPSPAPSVPAATNTAVVQPVNTASGDSDAAAQEKARAALLATMAATSPEQPMTSRPTTPALASPVPIVAPAVPISATKEQRLQALLAQYKADQINPEEYHKQRAAILAEP